jgi:16S rRNA processing protein RimM
MLPFSKRVVPEVDIAGGRIVVDPPAEIEVKPEEESTTEAQRHREDEVLR